MAKPHISADFLQDSRILQNQYASHVSLFSMKPVALIAKGALLFTLQAKNVLLLSLLFRCPPVGRIVEGPRRISATGTNLVAFSARSVVGQS